MAFTQVKTRVYSSSLRQPFLVQTDASERGVGAVLSQHDENGEEYSVAFFKQKLLPREEPYVLVEKECLAS